MITDATKFADALAAGEALPKYGVPYAHSYGTGEDENGGFVRVIWKNGQAETFRDTESLLGRINDAENARILEMTLKDAKSRISYFHLGGNAHNGFDSNILMAPDGMTLIRVSADERAFLHIAPESGRYTKNLNLAKATIPIPRELHDFLGMEHKFHFREGFDSYRIAGVDSGVGDYFLDSLTMTESEFIAKHFLEGEMESREFIDTAKGFLKLFDTSGPLQQRYQVCFAKKPNGMAKDQSYYFFERLDVNANLYRETGSRYKRSAFSFPELLGQIFTISLMYPRRLQSFREYATSEFTGHKNYIHYIPSMKVEFGMRPDDNYYFSFEGHTIDISRDVYDSLVDFRWPIRQGLPAFMSR